MNRTTGRPRVTRGGRCKRFLGIAVLLCGTVLVTSPLCAEEMTHSPSDGGDGHAQHVQSSPTAVDKAAEPAHSAHSEAMDTGEAKHEMDMTVKLTPEMLKRSDVRIAPVEYRTLVREIQTVGEIAYDERRVKVVSAWIGGRIDKLYVNFTGVNVKKGEPLAELYSPELISTQQEYILALETRDKMEAGGNKEALTEANDLVTATRQRLRFWGISEEQIDEMEKSCQVVCSEVTIEAPIGGTVIHKAALEGQYVKTGDKLYTIADLSMVWAMADIYEDQIAWVKPNQEVTITSTAYPGHTLSGTVSFIEPFLNKQTRSVKVRMDVPNSGLILKPGMFVDARLKIPQGEKPVLSVPHTAVLDTGVRKLAFVDLGDGLFEPVEIEVGPRAGDWVPVLSGLKEGQRVAVTAAYLIDSQSTLRGTSGEYGGAIGHGHGGH